MDIPKEMEFIRHQFNFSTDRSQQQNQLNAPNKKEEFTSEDRQSLKNAFRYITRLIFKEAQRYQGYLYQLAQQLELPIDNKKRKKVTEYFEGAEEISGERYFRHYISEKTQPQRKFICRYMLWFLQTKYLRYVNDEGKGKRKQMKKKLYIKFKNQVMMPYLQAMA